MNDSDVRRLQGLVNDQAKQLAVQTEAIRELKKQVKSLEDSGSRIYRREKRRQFKTILDMMEFEQDYYASSTEFHSRMNGHIDMLERIADNQFLSGGPLLKALVIGLRAGISTTPSGLKAALLAEVEKLDGIHSRPENATTT